MKRLIGKKVFCLLLMGGMIHSPTVYGVGYECKSDLGNSKTPLTTTGSSRLYVFHNDDENVVLKKTYCKNPFIEFKARSEVDILKSLDHPNIVKYKGSFEYERCVYLVTEYINGRTLDQCTNLSMNDKLKIIRQILEALSYLHSQGVVHNDIKPQNILVDENNNAKLIDFDSATRISDNVNDNYEKFGEFLSTAYSLYNVGTLDYMPPEGNSQYNPKADIWGLGCCFYELLTGEKLFSPDGMCRDSSCSELNKIGKIGSSTTLFQSSMYASDDEIRNFNGKGLLITFNNAEPLIKRLITKMMINDCNKRYSADKLLEIYVTPCITVRLPNLYSCCSI